MFADFKFIREKCKARFRFIRKTSNFSSAIDVKQEYDWSMLDSSTKLWPVAFLKLPSKCYEN